MSSPIYKTYACNEGAINVCVNNGDATLHASVHVRLPCDRAEALQLLSTLAGLLQKEVLARHYPSNESETESLCEGIEALNRHVTYDENVVTI